MEKLLMEKAVVKVCVAAVDLNTGANTGERINMKGVKRVSFYCFAAAGTTPSSHTFSFQQHDAATAGNSANLTIASPYYYKVDTATYFTKVEPTAGYTFDLDTVVGDTKYELVFEVLAEEVGESYQWVSINQTDSAGAQLGAIVAICEGLDSLPGYTKAV